MSEKFETVKYYYALKLWNDIHVRNAVVKQWITPDEYKLITGKDYEQKA